MTAGDAPKRSRGADRHSVRCQDDLWYPAVDLAQARGTETVSDVVRWALAAYQRDPDGLLLAIAPPAEPRPPAVPEFSHEELPQRSPPTWASHRPVGHGAPVVARRPRSH